MGLVTPYEALSGFSNSAVITIWAMFILSASLARTGIANFVGRQILRLAGGGQTKLIVLIMLSAGIMSAFMNNIGVAALLLPVVMDIAKQSRIAPSKLLMPLSISSLLGGLTTLIGTPSNLLISDALVAGGYEPFHFFDFFPFGIVVLFVGILFMVFIGHRWLPTNVPKRELSDAKTDTRELFGIQENLFMINLPPSSNLIGKTVAECRFGSTLGVNVLSILRGNKTLLSPDPSTNLLVGDRLLVSGQTGRVANGLRKQDLVVLEEGIGVEKLVSTEIEIAEVEFHQDCIMVGQTLAEIDFRRRFKMNVLAIFHNDTVIRTGLGNHPIHPGDRILIQGSKTNIQLLNENPNLIVSGHNSADVYAIEDRLIAVRISSESGLIGKTLVESRLGNIYDLTILGIIREGKRKLVPSPTEKLKAGDTLIMEGDIKDFSTLSGLDQLDIDQTIPLALDDLESEFIGLEEVVLSPHTTLAGKTLQQIHFRSKYGLSVLSIWRDGHAYYTNLRNMALRFGDSLLLYGHRNRLRILASDPDFLILTEDIQPEPRFKKAPLALLIMFCLITTVILGWLPIALAGIIGVSLVVLTGCLTMEEAYRAIEWKSVFLIAGTLPLGIALENSGAASVLAKGIITFAGNYGVPFVISSLFLITSAASIVIPNPALAVLIAPITLDTASTLGLSPHALIMVVAVAIATPIMSPIGHPANILVMGPANYRFRDFFRVGFPLILLILLCVLLIMPLFWSFPL